MNYNVYDDIVKRTNGDIYIGVVGPVRTGKSTFIKKFMEQLVIPNIDNSFKAQRAIDELPQSGSGRSIMTTEPKFIPNEAININIGQNTNLKVRLIDCVGYIVEDAIGYEEEGIPRMVNTPWFDEAIPFTEAAEIGTKKVINQHSTIGILMITDGTIVDIPRDKYLEAEERVIKELKAINKPFIVALNTKFPESKSVEKMKEEIMDKYNVPVVILDVMKMTIEDISLILKEVLYEFPVREININLPIWVSALEQDHRLKVSVKEWIQNNVIGLYKIRDVLKITSSENEAINTRIADINLGNGKILIEAMISDKEFYKVINENTNKEVNNQLELLNLISEYTGIYKQYIKISNALNDVYRLGYGVVLPDTDELKLDKPEIINQGNKFGMKLRASAPSVHMISADVDTEITPFIGTENECKQFMDEIIEQFEKNPNGMWQTEIFGKTLHTLVIENLHSKISRIPDDAQGKLQLTISKLLNENAGGIICIFI